MRKVSDLEELEPIFNLERGDYILVKKIFIKLQAGFCSICKTIRGNVGIRYLILKTINFDTSIRLIYFLFVKIDNYK